MYQWHPKKLTKLELFPDICANERNDFEKFIGFGCAVMSLQGDERRNFQGLESNDSLNGRNLFSELFFL